ncbi:hypothetical protein ADIS_0568 [Lunatimonas lonarensis]|uniref:PqqD family protein n=1 Tax=Lunatimonas lonarensis TaxID=1232681 RepID=R7ZXU4_9BACT|nr:PqqD family protein [Lunatimonas lonarensis]EON78975.1 hypothetical protein ADIS_0568 [Lunatimonas lonarensis]
MENKVYKVNEERVLFTQLDDEGVLFDIENNQYLNLNPTFCSIFNYLQEGMDLSGVKEKLMQEYEVDEQTCESQLTKTVAMLLEKGYIHEGDTEQG